MKEGKWYSKDTADFLDELKDLGQIPDGALLFTADVVGLYPMIPHAEVLEVLKFSHMLVLLCTTLKTMSVETIH